MGTKVKKYHNIYKILQYAARRPVCLGKKNSLIIRFWNTKCLYLELQTKYTRQNFLIKKRGNTYRSGLRAYDHFNAILLPVYAVIKVWQVPKMKIYSHNILKTKD